MNWSWYAKELLRVIAFLLLASFSVATFVFGVMFLDGYYGKQMCHYFLGGTLLFIWAAGVALYGLFLNSFEPDTVRVRGYRYEKISQNDEDMTRLVP